MSHIIILFIAIAFIIQASFLLHFAIQEGDVFLKTSRTTPEDLLIQYSNMKKTSSLQTWFFQHAPYWFPTIPSFRNDIRNKLMELLFIEQHKLPEEFRFAQYISKLFQKYISELGEVSWINWIILGGLVGLNFIKIKSIDSIEINIVCGSDSANEGDEGRRFLQDGEEGETAEICYAYIFEYGIFVVGLLVCFLQLVYVISSYYFEELLVIACKRQNIPVTKEKGRHAYIEILELMVCDEDEEQRVKALSTDSKDTKKTVFKESAKPKIGRRYTLKTTSPLKNPLLANDSMAEGDKEGQERDDVDAALLEEQLQNIQDISAERKEKTSSFCGSILSYFRKGENRSKIVNKKEDELQSIFIFGSAELYFTMVELCLLLQCFYIAMWATQVIPMIVLYHENQWAWGIAFTLPGVYNFLIIRMILTRAVMLQAICGVHAEVLGEVKEEAIEEEHCLDKLRKAVRNRFTTTGVTDDNSELSEELLTAMKVNFKNLFTKYDDDGSGDIGTAEFLTLLTDLKVYISKRAFKILWQAIDFDLSGEISWDEMFIILFPELKSAMKAELAIVRVLRTAISDRLLGKNIRDRTKMTEYMRLEFDRFDDDKSGFIDEVEMLTLVHEYLPKMADKEAKKLFAAIDVDGEGGIEWMEFRELVFGVEQIQDQRSTNWL